MTFQLFHSTHTLKHFENKYNLQRFVFKSMPSKNYAVKKLWNSKNKKLGLSQILMI